MGALIRHPKTIPIIMLLGGAAGTGYFAADPAAGAFGSAETRSGCNIKGNISINSGQRIYHVPGQHYYSETTIRPEFGERWFCSEGEAQRAGWRRARR
jgi:hypothetical protein